MVFCCAASGLASLVISVATIVMQEPAGAQAAAAAAPTAQAAEATAPAAATVAAPAAAKSGSAGEQPAAGARKVQPDPPGWVQYLPLACIGIMVYMILMRPQQKE
ncbi:MAG: hypothetical protein ACK57O_02730, partial [Planctomyces sp.]